MDEEFQIPYITVKETISEVKGRNLNVKPLFKLKIKDLLEIPLSEENNHFIFRENQISLVMFGGRIDNIFRDDAIFSFQVNDGTGTIRCFHKVKEDTTVMMNNMDRNLNSSSGHFDNIATCSQSQEVTMFNNTANDTILNNYDKESEEMMKEVLFWFKEEIIAKCKGKDIGDIIHVSGHLLESDSIRKINVVDFRIVESSEEHQDFLLELDYLYKHAY